MFTHFVVKQLYYIRQLLTGQRLRLLSVWYQYRRYNTDGNKLSAAHTRVKRAAAQLYTVQQVLAVKMPDNSQPAVHLG